MKSKYLYKLLSVLLAVFMLLTLCSCGKKKILHCDNCGKAVEVKESSNMEEDWTIYCKECEKELGLDNIVPVE